MPYQPPANPDDNSKSKRKNEMLNLQKLGETLLRLPATQLEKVPLPSILSQALAEAKRITANEAKRRHLQYIGKIMRDIDVEPIKAALQILQRAHQQTTQQFHEVEAWRETLITKGDAAINELLVEHPHIDRQQLRQLIRNAQNDRKIGKNTGGEKALFQFLREILT